MENFYNIPEYEGLYRISKDGRVLTSKKYTCNGGFMPEKIMKHQYDYNGYPLVRLTKNNKGKTIRIHSLLAKMFIPNPNNLPCVNHRDGNKRNCNLDNLEWCTHAENSRHAFKAGLKNNRGENQSRAKLKELDVITIRSMYPQMMQKDIAKIYGMSKSAVQSIISRRTWTHI